MGSVAGMLVLIRLGTVVLDNAGKTELRPALIVVAVGLHFLPFAAVFSGIVMLAVIAGDAARAVPRHSRPGHGA